MAHDSPKTPRIHYPPEEVAARLNAWSRLPATQTEHMAARNAAWNRYCDARDQIPDGTTQIRQQRDYQEPRDLTQQDLFKFHHRVTRPGGHSA